MKGYADKKRRDHQLSIGDWVFVKLRPHRQQSVATRINQKLAPRYYGPFQIIQKYGEVSYKLQLPATSKVHPVFHVSQLKKAIGTSFAEPDLPASLELHPSDMVQPATILDNREIREGNKKLRQYLI